MGYRNVKINIGRTKQTNDGFIDFLVPCYASVVRSEVQNRIHGSIDGEKRTYRRVHGTIAAIVFY